MDISWPLFIIICFIVIAVIWLLNQASINKYPYVSKPLLTRAELNFYRYLTRACPKQLTICLKPRLGDLIDVHPAIQNQDRQWKGKFGAPIWSKHIDFALIDPNSSAVVLCIELDDRSHNTPEAKERDKFKNKALKAAGLSLLRIQNAPHYDLKTLTADIETTMIS